jgi:hypothetical protein
MEGPVCRCHAPNWLWQKYYVMTGPMGKPLTEPTFEIRWVARPSLPRTLAGTS